MWLDSNNILLKWKYRSFRTVEWIERGHNGVRRV